MAAQAERVGHLLANQIVDDDLGTVEAVVGRAFELWWLSISGAVIT
jgi:hypothetical protein